MAGTSTVAATPALSLTRRETDALIAYAQTGDMRSAADAIGVALPTVKNHFSSAYAKLNVSCSIDAFRVLGWLSVPGSAVMVADENAVRASLGRIRDDLTRMLAA